MKLFGYADVEGEGHEYLLKEDIVTNKLLVLKKMTINNIWVYLQNRWSHVYFFDMIIEKTLFFLYLISNDVNTFVTLIDYFEWMARCFVLLHIVRRKVLSDKSRKKIFFVWMVIILYCLNKRISISQDMRSHCPTYFLTLNVTKKIYFTHRMN